MRLEAKFIKNQMANKILYVSLGIIILGSILDIQGWNEYFTSAIYYENDEGIFSPLMHFAYAMAGSYESNVLGFIMICLGLLGIIMQFIFRFIMNGCELTITDTKVQGKTSFKKTVDLPIQQISAIGLSWGSRITVSTSSGTISFWLIENRDEIYGALNQAITQSPNVEVKPSNSNNLDELKQLKDFLDSGIITQEEFDAKKKQLLGL